MRAALAIVSFATFLIFVFHGPAHSQTYDIGVIESMNEGSIYVKGNHGLHRLELLGTCLWCEVGVEVLVAFQGFTRATLSPYPRASLGRTVKAFIIKDGREEAEAR